MRQSIEELHIERSVHILQESKTAVLERREESGPADLFLGYPPRGIAHISTEITSNPSTSGSKHSKINGFKQVAKFKT
jgi:hypothetical protein